MADKNGTAETTDGKNGTTATVPKGILTNPLPIAASGTSGDRDPMVAEAQSAANNNMPNANSNAKISNGPGMTEKTLQGVEMASSEARTTLMTPVILTVLYLLSFHISYKASSSSEFYKANFST